MMSAVSKRARFAGTILIAGLALAPFAAAQTQLPPPTNQTLADERQDQIEELQAQLNTATAENERLQHDLAVAQREVARLQTMVNDLTAANAANAPPPTATDGAAAPSTLSPAQAARVGQLGTVSSSAPAASTTPADPAEAFRRARALLDAGNLAEAEEAFADFVQANPNATNAPAARYWLAYTLLARNNFDDATTTFADYLRRYPNGAQAADAQVGLGVALAGNHNNAQACTAFSIVPRRYPHAAQTVRDRAAREARALHCPAT